MEYARLAWARPTGNVAAATGNNPTSCPTFEVELRLFEKAVQDEPPSLNQRTISGELVWVLNTTKSSYSPSEDILIGQTIDLRWVVIEAGSSIAAMKGYLKECLVKCMLSAQVIIHNPAHLPAGNGGSSACPSTSNGPKAFNMHNGTSPPPQINFNGQPTITIVAYNRWGLDGPKDTAVQIDLVFNHFGQFEYQIMHIQEHFARWICGTYSNGYITVSKAMDGVNPEDSCGAISLNSCVPAIAACLEGHKVWAAYDPETSSQSNHNYELMSSTSALLGPPDEITAVDHGDSPGNGVQFEGCGLDIPGVKSYAFKCDLGQPSNKSINPDLLTRTVLTGVQIGTNQWIFSTEVHYVCNYAAGANITINGTDCAESSSSS